MDNKDTRFRDRLREFISAAKIDSSAKNVCNLRLDSINHFLSILTDNSMVEDMFWKAMADALLEGQCPRDPELGRDLIGDDETFKRRPATEIEFIIKPGLLLNLDMTLLVERLRLCVRILDFIETLAEITGDEFTHLEFAAAEEIKHILAGTHL